MNQKSSGFKLFFDWLAVVAWFLVIYYFSEQPSLKSQLEPLWDLIFRKIAHISEYFVLSYLLVRALKNHFKSEVTILITAGIGAITLAAFDELHQLFIIGRTGNGIDVVVDSVGIILCLVALYKTKTV